MGCEGSRIKEKKGEDHVKVDFTKKEAVKEALLLISPSGNYNIETHGSEEDLFESLIKNWQKLQDVRDM